MARIRIYQSLFNSPPLQRPDALGVPLENKADVRARLARLDGVVNASGLSYVFPLQRPALPTGWTVEPPTTRPRLARLDGVVNASGLSYVFPLSRTQVLGAPLVASADVRQRLPQLDGAIIASGANGPELWNPPVTVVAPVTTGWEFQQPTVSVRRNKHRPHRLSIGTSPEPEVAATATGWTITLPDLPRRRSVQPLAVLDSISLPLEGDTDQQGWNVSLAELKQVKPRIGFADASVDSQSWSPLESVAAQPWGWSLPPPRGRVVPESVFAGADQAELYNPPIEVTQPDSGWTINLPELAPRKRLPQGEFTTRSDQPAEAAATGWNVALPDLPQFRRKQALPDQPSGLERPGSLPAAVNWTVEPPLTHRRPTVLAGALAGATLAPQAITQAAQTGWNVVVPDLPQFRRKQALPELAGRIDQPAELATRGWNIVQPDLPQFKRKQALPETTARIDQPSGLDSARSLGWIAELPHITRGTFRGGILAGAVLAPQDITQPAQTGWDIVLPDLPAFRRKHALPEFAGRIDQPQQLAVGHSIVLPDLPAFRRKSALPETASGRLDRPQEQPYGATVTLPDLPQFRRKQALPEVASGRIDQPSAIQAQSLGWICELPLFTRVDTYRGGGALAGASLAPQVVTQAAATGWDIVLPDLPAFRRKQVRVDNIDRLDQPAAITGTVFEEGWSVVLPNLPQFKRKQALPELAGRIDKPTAAFQWGWSVVLPDVVARPRRLPVEPQGRLDQPQGQPSGWNVVTPDLPQARTRPDLTEIAGRVDQPEEQPYGWSVVTPDLPQARRHPALTEIAGRIDTPVVVVVQATSGWAVDPPALRQTRPISGGIFAGATHDPPQIEPSTTPAVTARQQTYFVANLGRFMRRG